MPTRRNTGRRAKLAEDLRRHAPHSPVVTPALAQAMEGSMTLRLFLGSRASSARALFAAGASR